MKKTAIKTSEEQIEQLFNANSVAKIILDIKEIRDLEDSVRNDCLSINGGKLSFQERIERFKKSDLATFRKSIEEEDFQTNKKYIKDIIKLNSLLIDNPQVLKEAVTTLLDIQSRLLAERKIDEEKQKIEILHIKSVTRLAVKSFPNNPLLTLIAAAHDSFKHISNHHVELALHELASSKFGPELIVSTLEIVTKNHKIEIASSLIESVRKISARSIYTHGNEEFTENMSKNLKIGDTNDRLFNLFGKLYPGTKKRSTPANFGKGDKINVITEIIAAINACDMIVGSNLESLDKYNLANEISHKFISKNFNSYLEDDLLFSFHTNLQGKSVELFKLDDINHPIINNIGKTKAVMQFVLDLFSQKSEQINSSAIKSEVAQAEEITSIFKKIKSRQRILFLINIFHLKNKALEEDSELKKLDTEFNENFSEFISSINSLSDKITSDKE